MNIYIAFIFARLDAQTFTNCQTMRWVKVFAAVSLTLCVGFILVTRNYVTEGISAALMYLLTLMLRPKNLEGN